MLDDVFRDKRCDPVIASPVDEVCRIGGTDDIDSMDAAGLLLTYALKIPLRSRALDAHCNAGIFRFERLRQSFRCGELERRIEGNLGFLARGIDQRRGDRDRRRCRGLGRLREDGAGEEPGGGLQQVASRIVAWSHGVRPIWLLVVIGSYSELIQSGGSAKARNGPPDVKGASRRGSTAGLLASNAWCRDDRRSELRIFFGQVVT